MFNQRAFQNHEKFWFPKITSKYSKALKSIASVAIKNTDNMVIIFIGEFFNITLITKKESGLNPSKFLIFLL